LISEGEWGVDSPCYHTANERAALEARVCIGQNIPEIALYWAKTFGQNNFGLVLSRLTTRKEQTKNPLKWHYWFLWEPSFMSAAANDILCHFIAHRDLREVLDLCADDVNAAFVRSV
jgi:hypothetical protein